MSDQQPTADDDDIIVIKQIIAKPKKEFYLPPGRTTCIRNWDCLDVQLWMTQFIPMKARNRVFLALIREKVDGKKLLEMLRWNDNKVRGNLKFDKELCVLLMANAYAVTREHEKLVTRIKKVEVVTNAARVQRP